MTTGADSAANAADALTQATHWFVLLASGSASDADHAGWRQWCEADPAHGQTWARVQAASAPFAAVPGARKPAALQALLGKRPPRHRGTLLSLAILCGLALGGWQGYRASDWSADALTAVGEQRELQLEDGSRVVLDTNTAIDIDFNGEQRLLHLRRGRVFIVTGHRAEFARQTFAVTTAQAQITALGTQFSVQQQALHTRVAVIEDRVAVQTHSADRIIVDAGHGAQVDAGGNIERTTLQRNDSAWQRGMLIADDMPLGEFIAELGRYHAGPLRCDAAIAQLRISGAFPLRDTGQILAALGETLPVRIERHTENGGEGGIIVRAK